MGESISNFSLNSNVQKSELAPNHRWANVLLYEFTEHTFFFEAMEIFQYAFSLLRAVFPHVLNNCLFATNSLLSNQGQSCPVSPGHRINLMLWGKAAFSLITQGEVLHGPLAIKSPRESASLLIYHLSATSTPQGIYISRLLDHGLSVSILWTTFLIHYSPYHPLLLKIWLFEWAPGAPLGEQRDDWFRNRFINLKREFNLFMNRNHWCRLKASAIKTGAV